MNTLPQSLDERTYPPWTTISAAAGATGVRIALAAIELGVGLGAAWPTPGTVITATLVGCRAEATTRPGVRACLWRGDAKKPERGKGSDSKFL